MDTSHKEDVDIQDVRDSPEGSSIPPLGKEDHVLPCPTLTDIERPIWVLPVIVASQFASTSLWFAGNAVLDGLTVDLGLPDGSVGFLSSSVQFGFILGTLVFALGSVADRFLPTRVFMTCAISGALANVAVTFAAKGLAGLLILRGLTGFFLAGIYPVGMKVAADWYGNVGLGGALGYLVGALVLGTAFPFLLRQIKQSWQALLIEVSVLSSVAGLTMGFICPDGPHRKASGPKFEPMAILYLFSAPDFRAAAFGYFGHMWELYAFYFFLPVVWEDYLTAIGSHWNVNLITFFIIAMGSLGCVVGGILANRWGSAPVACGSLFISGVCCLLSPLFYRLPAAASLVFYLVWGATVASDSPQFSTLVSNAAPAEKRGSALTITNCIGFTITIASIQLLNSVPIPEKYLFLLLSPGPIFGLWSMRTFLRSSIRGSPSKNGQKTIEMQTLSTTSEINMQDEYNV
eukprot:scaffold13204_cov36-Attheya_sp.AAC.1